MDEDIKDDEYCVLLQKFVSERFFYSEDVFIDKNTLLFSTKIIDSINVMELLIKIEELFGVMIEIPDLVDSNADCIYDIVMLAKKLNKEKQDI
jgi:acyl carrier protein